MQIKINSKQDQKMLETFPDDPYSDLCIVTQTRRLNLVLAYLSIDSNFFSRIDPDTRQINLSHFNEQPLLRIIRSLYGQTLIANTIPQLTQLYHLIKQLEIDDYKQNIEKEIAQKTHIIESIQFLQFSFTNNLLVEKVIESHIENKLKLLQSNRNYLQLNKISVATFQTLVERFIVKMMQKYGSLEVLLTKPESQIVNHVMENYLNRNAIKALSYFQQSNSKYSRQMETIWNKYHHSVYFTPTSNVAQSMVNLSSMRGTASQFLSTKSPQQDRLRKKSQEVININAVSSSPLCPDIEKKKRKIKQLEQQLKQREEIIIQLQKQIDHVKQSRIQSDQKIVRRSSGGTTNGIVPQVLDEQQLIKGSVQQQSLSYLPNIKKPRKSKQYDEEQDFTVSSVFQPAFNGNRKLPQTKEIRTMKKVTVTRNKFLPN